MATISIRVADVDLAEIDRRTRAHGYPNRTAFLLGVALSENLAQTAEETRFESIEKRLGRLEEATWPNAREATWPSAS